MSANKSKDDIIQELAMMLVDDPEISSHSWHHLVVVAQMNESATDASGFAYQQDGTAIATGPENFDFLDKVEELREAMHEPGKQRWKACLIRVESDSGKYAVAFEYDNPEKWAINSANVKQMAESLRHVH